MRVRYAEDGRSAGWRVAAFCLFVLSLSAAIVLTRSLALCYDTGYYAWNIADTGSPFLPHGRVGAVVFQVPALISTHLTDDNLAVSFFLVLGYALAPCLALALSWLAVRRRNPRLFVWPVVSICLFSFPAQFVLAAEVLLVALLAWPLLLWSLSASTRADLGLVWHMGWALFLCLLHPLAAVPLGLAACALLVRFAVNRAKWFLGASVVLLIGSALRMFAFRAQYETDTLSVENLVSTFQGAVIGTPVVLLVCAALISIALLVMETTSIGAKRSVRFGGMVVIVSVLAVSCANMWGWSADPFQWMSALGYRWFAVLFLLPVFLFAAAHQAFGRFRGGASASRALSLVPVACGVVWLCLLTVQGVGWRGEVDQLMHKVEASRPCFAVDDYSVQWSALRHWGVTPLSLMLQGAHPTGLALSDGLCKKWDFTKGIPVTSWEVREWGAGRVDLSRIRDGIARE